jgi:hypothetical protein
MSCLEATYADVCGRMLTYADVCWQMPAGDVVIDPVTADGAYEVPLEAFPLDLMQVSAPHADLCWRMLAYAGVC